MATENIGGVDIAVGADLSQLDSQFAEAANRAVGYAQQMSDALSGIKGPDLSSVIGAVSQLGEYIRAIGEEARNVGNQLDVLKEKISQIGEIGNVAIEAADKVDDATQAIARLGGGVETAAATVAQLRTIAADEALSFPNLLIAAQRMTAFLGSAEQVPAIMAAAGDDAAIMGTDVETASRAIERLVTSSDLSERSMRALGLSMADIAKALGTTEDSAKEAYAALGSTEKVDVALAALQKFSGAAKQMNDDALGALTRAGQQWDEVLEEIGKALDPVMRQLIDFGTANIIQPIKDLAIAFNQLPEPVKDFGVALGIAAAAIVPITGALAAISVAVTSLVSIFGTVSAAIGGMATAFGLADGAAAGLAAALPEVVIPLAAIAAAIALIDFDGLKEQIRLFSDSAKSAFAGLQEPIDAAAEALKQFASDVADDLKDFGSQFVTLAHQIQEFAADVADTIGPLVYQFSPLKAAIDAVAESMGHVDGVQFKDALDLATGAIAPFLSALKGMSDYLKILQQSLSDVKSAFDLLTGDFATSKSSIDAASSALDKLQQANAAAARAAADAVMNYKAAKEAVDPYAKAVQDLYDAQGKANDTLARTSAVLQAVKQDFRDGQASAEDLARAQKAYDDAVKSASVSTDAMKDSLKAAADAAKEFAEQTKAANDTVVQISSLMDRLPANIHDYFQQLADGGKNATQMLAEVETEIGKAVDASVKLSGAPLAAVQEWIAKLRDAQGALKDLAEDVAWDEFSAKVSLMATKYPQQVSEMTGSLKDLVTQAIATAQDVPEAFTKIDPTALIQKWLETQKQLDDQTQKMGDHFQEAMNKYRESVENTAIPITATLADRLNGISNLFRDTADNAARAFNPSAISQYLQYVRDLNADGLKTLQQQEAEIGNWETLLAKAREYNLTYGQQLDLQAQILRGKIQIANQTGQDADQLVLALEKIKLKHDDLKTSATAWAEAEGKAIEDGLKGFDQLGQAMADAIVNGNNLGDALVAQFKRIAATILGDLIQGALYPLKKGLEEMISSLLPDLKSGFDTSATAAKAMQDAANRAAQAADDMANSAQNVSKSIDGGTGTGGLAGSISHLGSIISTVSDVISAGAAVASTIILSHISSDTGHIEVNTRQAFAELTNIRADDWSQFGQTYDRLGELLDRLNHIMDSTAQMAASGGGGGIGSDAKEDLDVIATSIQHVEANLGYVNNSIQGLNQSLTPWLQEVVGDLQTINSTLYMINTSILAGNATAQSISQSVSAQAEALDSVRAEAHGITSSVEALVPPIHDGAVITANTIDAAAQQAQRDAQAALNAAQSVDAQIAALQAEYARYQVLMNQALAIGNVELATQYQQQAQAVMRQIASLQEGQVAQTGQITQAVTSGAQTGAYAATNSGTLVATAVANSAGAVVGAVNNAANTIGAYVAAAITSASYKPTDGTLTSTRSQGSGPYAGQTPSLPTNQQSNANPGYAPVGNPSSNAPPTNTGNTPGKDKQTFVPAGPSNPVQAPSEPGTAAGSLPVFAGGGLMASSGIAHLEGGEYVLTEPQKDAVIDQLGAEPATRANKPGTTVLPSPSDYNPAWVAPPQDQTPLTADQRAKQDADARAQMKQQLELLQSYLASAIANGAAVQAKEFQMQLDALKAKLGEVGTAIKDAAPKGGAGGPAPDPNQAAKDALLAKQAASAVDPNQAAKDALLAKQAASADALVTGQAKQTATLDGIALGLQGVQINTAGANVSLQALLQSVQNLSLQASFAGAPAALGGTLSLVHATDVSGFPSGMAALAASNPLAATANAAMGNQAITINAYGGNTQDVVRQVTDYLKMVSPNLAAVSTARAH